jgi:hypothetical protein
LFWQARWPAPGWYVLARATTDAVQERAFGSKQRVLAGDRQFRAKLVIQLRQLAVVPGFPGEQLERMADELAPAEHEEIARYDTIQLNDTQVAMLEQYDDLLWQRVRWLRDHADGRASASEAVDQLQRSLDQRSDLLTRGRQAPSIAPSILLAAPARLGSAAVEALDVGDAVTFEGSDYVLESVATGFSDGQTWKLTHVVPSGAGATESWLSVAHGGLDVAWLESLAPTPLPGTIQMLVQGASLPVAASRSAITRVSTSDGTTPGVLVRTWSYQAGSLVGLVEQWPDSVVHAYGGRSVTPDPVQVWPASRSVLGGTS